MSETKSLNLAWGAKNIGKALDLAPRQVFHLWQHRGLKSLKKINGRLVLNINQAREELAASNQKSA